MTDDKVRNALAALIREAITDPAKLRDLPDTILASDLLSADRADAQREVADAVTITAWRHVRWIEGHAGVPVEIHLRPKEGTGANPISAPCHECGEVIVPSAFEWVAPMYRAEGSA